MAAMIHTNQLTSQLSHQLSKPGLGQTQQQRPPRQHVDQGESKSVPGVLTLLRTTFKEAVASLLSLLLLDTADTADTAGYC